MLKNFNKKLPKQPKYSNIHKYKLSLRVYTAAIFWIASNLRHSWISLNSIFSNAGRFFLTDLIWHTYITKVIEGEHREIDNTV
jgi:hypothetical protein